MKVRERKATGKIPGTVNCTVGFFTQLLQNKFNALDYGTLFVLTYHILTDMVCIIKGKTNNYRKWPEGFNKNCFELQCSKRFDLSRVKLQ